MVPNFALFLSFEGISLLRRMAGGWARLDDVSLAELDLDAAMADLKETALGIDPKGDKVLLIIPNEQIRYLDLPDPGGDGAQRASAAKAALDGATPYAVSDLAFDHSASGGRLLVAAVARETLDEAEGFAITHGFQPVALAAKAPEGAFSGAVWFGPAMAWGKRKVSRLAKPVKVIESTEEAFQPVAPRKKPAPKRAADPLPDVVADVADQNPADVAGDDLSDAVVPEPVSEPLEDLLAGGDQADDPLADLTEPEPDLLADSPEDAADSASPEDLPLFTSSARKAPDTSEAEAAFLAEASPSADIPAEPAPPSEASDKPASAVRMALQANAAQAGKAPAIGAPGKTDIDAAFASTRTAPPIAPPDRRITEGKSHLGGSGPIKPRFTPVPPVAQIKMRDAAPDPVPLDAPKPAATPLPAASEPTPDTPKAAPAVIAEDAPAPAPDAKPQVTAAARAKTLGAAAMAGLTSRLTFKSDAPLEPADTATPDKPHKRLFGLLARKTEAAEASDTDRTKDLTALPPLAKPEAPKSRMPSLAPPKPEATPAPIEVPTIKAPAAAAPPPLSSTAATPATPAPKVSDIKPPAAKVLPPVSADAASGPTTGSGDKPETAPAPEVRPNRKAAARLAALTTRRRKPEADTPEPAPKPAAKPKAAIAPAITSDEERERMTVFGARGNAQIGGKPRFLGLGLTLGLLLVLVGIAAWASVFLDNGVARLFRAEDPPVQTASVTLPQGAPEAPALSQPLEPATSETATAAPQAPPVASLPEAPALPDTAEAPAEAPVQLAALDPEPQPEETAPALTQPIAPSRPPTSQEAELSYATTGIWQLSPESSATPPTDGVDDVYVASIDPRVQQFDAVALPSALSVAPEPGLPEQGLPPPADMRFDFDPRGLIRATPEGALSPDGLRIYTGLPPVVPPLRNAALQPLTPPALPEETAPAPQGTPDATQPLPESLLRPEARPSDLIEQRERATLGGNSLEELAAFRPLLRPRTAQEEAQTAEPDTPSTDQAVNRSLVPVTRPRDMATIVQRAETRRAAQPAPAPVQTASVAPRTVQPTAPTATSVSRAATVPNAINLNRVALIGVYGTASNRRALVRLPNGQYEKVKAGDRLDGGRVTAIGDSELLYNKAGRSLTLKMPRG